MTSITTCSSNLNPTFKKKNSDKARILLMQLFYLHQFLLKHQFFDTATFSKFIQSVVKFV